jgi:serine/threonine protein kinase
MTDVHRHLLTLFTEALACAGPAEQAAYLDRSCAGEPTVRARVEALLRAHREAGHFLQEEAPTPVTGATLADSPPGEPPGTVIGPYRLLEVLGEGGMGTVYLAEQTQPVQRQVALKVIRPGLDSRQVGARFAAERQALALMDHPHIAKVLDAGATPAGRPYFVMELVQGVPLTRYCDERRLTPRQRLELFVPVCQAVQHAHQKGIIHRDLKPSNVLVALYDGRPVAKVIDFGVAKATGPKLAEETLCTTFGQVVGTLEYMSPEQAKLNALDIDTRSDIYALGVLLYELLTGTTPFERQRLYQAALDEVLRIIHEEEPPRPSTRLSTTAELPQIAANRGVEPKKLSGLVRGELDWIVMKCLEKDRNRRYDTANSLAADLQRSLHDEPVTACPPSAWYRLRKSVRRHRTSVLAAGLVFLALLVGAVGSTWNWLDARAEREAKELARRQAQDNADAERKARRAREVSAYFRLIALANQRLANSQRTEVHRLLEECPAPLRQWEWYYLRRWYGGTPFVDLAFDTTPTPAWCVAFRTAGAWRPPSRAAPSRSGTCPPAGSSGTSTKTPVPNAWPSAPTGAGSPRGTSMARSDAVSWAP